MADRTFNVEIVTPERVVLRDEVTSLVAPGVLGSFGVLAHHAPMLAELSPGELRFRKNSAEETRMVVGGGFLQVFNNQVTVLADSAERVEEINLDRARTSLNRAREELVRAQAALDDLGQKDAQAAVERAQARIRVGGG